MTEEEIVNGCKRGNVNCQRLLYNNYYYFVMSICLRYSNSYEEAQDYVQEIMIKVFKNLVNYRFTGNFLGWIRTVSVNYMLNVVRDSNRPKNYAETIVIDENIDKEIVIEDADVPMTEIMKMIQELPSDFRTVFNLIVIDEYSYQEVAEMLNQNPSLLRIHLFRAKKILKSKIEAYLKDENDKLNNSKEIKSANISSPIK